ncbi:MAG: hypothetical protein LC799_11340 [Actinobacteria bacterium]|nr:hypothetical protein [Actinomycetota bacterium]
MTLFERLTLVIREGTIEQVFYPVFPRNEHVQQVLAWLGSRAAPPPEDLTPTSALILELAAELVRTLHQRQSATGRPSTDRPVRTK